MYIYTVIETKQRHHSHTSGPEWNVNTPVIDMMENNQCHDQENTSQSQKVSTDIVSCPTGQVGAGSQQKENTPHSKVLRGSFN